MQLQLQPPASRKLRMFTQPECVMGYMTIAGTSTTAPVEEMTDRGRISGRATCMPVRQIPGDWKRTFCDRHGLQQEEACSLYLYRTTELHTTIRTVDDFIIVKVHFDSGLLLDLYGAVHEGFRLAYVCPS